MAALGQDFGEPLLAENYFCKTSIPTASYALDMDAAATQPRNLFVASARLKNERIAIYTEEGTPIQNMEVCLGLIIEQLVCNGATRTNAERFFDDLNKQGFAELHQPITLTSFSVT